MTESAVRLDSAIVERARTLARAASVGVMLLGGIALAGWIFDAEVLKGFHAGITMKANAAVSLLLAGASLWLLCARSPRAGVRRAGQGAALAAGVIGSATLGQHLFGWNLGIDQLLFTEAPGALATTSPGRMGPPASISFTLAGVSLLLLYARRYTALAHAAAIGICLTALLGLTGYALSVESLYGVARFTGIALHTAIALFLLGLGLLASSVDRGPAAIMAGTGAGSVMTRRLLVFAVLVPPLLGWIRQRGEDLGYYDARFGLAALIVAMIVILTLLIVRTARLLDRTEQQQLAAEAKLRDRLHEIEKMMDVLPIGLFIATDPSGTHITGNRAARELLRMSESGENLSLSAPADEAPPHFRVFRDGKEVPAEELPVQRAARDGVALHDVELDVVFDDGSVTHELVSALPLLDSEGRPRGAVASVMDITARRIAEREREKLLASEQDARVQAEAANRAKDEFLATISHELRTPLNAILGWASMLGDGTVLDGEARSGALAAIKRNCRAQAQLIEDLLDVTRMRAGMLRLERKPVDLNVILTAAVDVVRPMADAGGVELRLQLGANPCLVLGDATRLQQIVWNLLANAVKFSSERGTVDVRLTKDAAEATVTVSDTGEGIDPDFLPYVFDRFSQAEGGKTRRHGGLGLGLSIAQHLIEMHGGTIAAESEGRGSGATFTLRLPLLGAAAGAGATSDSAEAGVRSN